MKKSAFIARILLGLIFSVFGLNGFLNFIPMPPPQGLASQFMGSLYANYLVVIMALQLIGGVLLLSGRLQALALLIVAPLVVNIFLFHAFMQPSGLPLAIVLVLLWFGAAWNVQAVFFPLLRAKSA